ncbi:MAG: superoxide dismutase [Bacteroidales bacterium]|jgi:Fe-Mn family superoxide dismutase|nr:superoxide dismutase [Bacteroidales bacterium]MBP9588672.1 superoxide dismutase [Bacteroidales bacterium]OQC60568.1 MAG: Superoxide dismutase (Mn/Fe) [Bacteroidetes bacterium ADurb.Bin012]
MKNSNKVIFTLLFFLGAMEVNVSAIDWPAVVKKLGDAQLTAMSVQQPLPYSYNALEPYIDARTMEIHYSKHHATYTANMNKAAKGQAFESVPLLKIFTEVDKYPLALRNNGGGFYNHYLYWEIMKPQGGGLPSEMLQKAIQEDFQDFETFKAEFSKAALDRFGSGWAWLSVDEFVHLFVSFTSNPDNSFMRVIEKCNIAILCFDGCEHVYYLNYRNQDGYYV